MQSKNSAVELIRRFQQLFADLDHKQIVQRLMRLVIAKSAISRAVLVVKRDNKLYVEAVAISQISDQVMLLDTPIEKLNQLPHRLFNECFNTGGSKTLDLTSHNQLPIADHNPEAVALHLQPIGDNRKPFAAFYLETKNNCESLCEAVVNLDSVWAFSALLIQQVVNMLRQEEQSEKFRIAEQALWASEAYLKAILYYSPALIAVKDLDGNVVLASEHYKQIAGLDEFDKGKSFLADHANDFGPGLWESDHDVIREGKGAESELELRHIDGKLHTYLMVKFPLRDQHGHIFGVCNICTDITERKQAEDALHEQQAKLNYMAFHDSLTGLPNRSLFYDRINHSLSRVRRARNVLAVMLLDLDRFKNINDSLGHDAGDVLLKIISERLLANVRDMDTVARLGGDEFVIVLEGVSEPRDAGYVAEKMLSSLCKPINIYGHEIATTVSVGISMFPRDGEAADELLKHADIAMYKAKEAGKNTYKFYAEGMNASAVNSLLLENDLRRAIEDGQLTLCYQPQIDLQTGSLVGLEALVRWRHEDRGLISPAHFIPLAEETGLIVPLGEWVIRTACAQQKKWLTEGKYVGKVAVNLSPRQFRQNNFAERIAEILMATELPAKYLELEITENSAMEHAGETITTLHLLNQMGLSLAIDDFGTGYSSLAYLKRFPIQKLKIDRSFISDITNDQNDAAIAKSIIGLAHNMSLNVVAEGVENQDQADWLRARGCDHAQGFLYAKPITAEQIESYFKDGSFGLNNNVVQLEVRA